MLARGMAAAAGSFVAAPVLAAYGFDGRRMLQGTRYIPTSPAPPWRHDPVENAAATRSFTSRFPCLLIEEL